jgi:hypothetical protein
MILFHASVEILHVADDDRPAMGFVIPSDRGRIGPTAGDRDRGGDSVTADRLGENARGRLLIALLREEAMDSLPPLIDGTIEVGP